MTQEPPTHFAVPIQLVSDVVDLLKREKLAWEKTNPLIVALSQCPTFNVSQATDDDG